MPARFVLLLLLLVGIAGVGGCTGDAKVDVPKDGLGEKVGPPLLRDVTADTGIEHIYHNGEEAGHYAILDSLGGGLGLIDYDNDGLYDIVLPGGGRFENGKLDVITGHPCKMYRNLGNFKFKDITKEVGLDKIDFYTHGVAVADFDRDGWPDFLITGWGRMALLHNEPVDPKDASKGRKFVDVTDNAGLTDTTWTTSAAWADFDGDGYPDLYVCQYVNWSPTNHPNCGGYTPKHPKDVCPPKTFVGLPHLLYRNNKDGTFTNVSKEAGLRIDPKLDKEGKPTHDIGKGLGVAAARFNEARRPSIFVANDTVENFLYINQGNWKFVEGASNRGVARDERGNANGNMGIGIGDYDRSGFASIFVATYENEMFALFRNLGKNGQFLYSTTAAGIAALGQRNVGFGSAFVDLDQDGWEDLMIINGHVIMHPDLSTLAQKPVLMRNDRFVKPDDPTKGRRFIDISKQGGSYCTSEHRGRGLAMGDLDNDGRPDFAISNVNEPTAVLRGIVGEESGKRPHWLGLDLKGKNFRDIVGTRIIIEVGGQKLTRFIVGGSTYMSANDPRILVGLGDWAKVDRITIEWSHNDKDQVIDFASLPIDRYYIVNEGEAEPVEWTKVFKK